MTRIFLAGAEVDALLRPLLDNGVKNILVSYFYIVTQDREEPLARYQEEYPDVNWFLDSGAFTYFTKFQRDPGRLMPYREYVRKYFMYLAEYGRPYCRVTEPDLDNTIDGITVGMVDGWREQLLDEFPHLPIMPCWHWWRGPEAWTSYCKDPRIKHLAIGRKSGEIGYQRRLILEAHRHGKTVHGFGMTRVNTDMRVLPADSFDSSVDGKSLVWVRSVNYKRVEVLPIEDLHAAWLRGEYRGWSTLTVQRGPLWYEQVWRPLANVIEHEVTKPYCEVTLEGGRKLRVTGDHSLFQMTPNGALCEVKPTDLCVGNYLATIRAPVWSGKGLTHRLARWTKKTIKNRWNPRGIPNHGYLVELDSVWLEFCGLWLADGCYADDHTVSMSCINDEECASVVGKVAARFGRTVKDRGNGVDGYICSVRLVSVMRALGLVGHSHTKQIPGWFWSLSREQAGAFLRGYFSGDGTGGVSPEVSTVSRKLWRQLCEAVPAVIGEPIGCRWSKNTGRSSFGGPRKPSGRVTMPSIRAKEAFLRHIGFLQAAKTNSVISTLGVEDRGGYFDGVPVGLASRCPRRSTGFTVAGNVDRLRRDTDPSAFRSHVLSPDILYLRVEKIAWLEEKQRKVYDMSVPGTERFIAGGVLVHNTRWLMGQQYGTLFVFQDGVFRQIPKELGKQRRRLFMNHFKKIGCDWRKVLNDDVKEVRKANIIAWRDLSTRMEVIRKIQMCDDGVIREHYGRLHDGHKQEVQQEEAHYYEEGLEQEEAGED